MSERDKLFELRKKLVLKRRAIVGTFVTAPPDMLTGESIARIQGAIDAVDRAIADEGRAGQIGSEIGLPAEDGEKSNSGPAVAGSATGSAPVAFRAPQVPPTGRPK